MRRFLLASVIGVGWASGCSTPVPPCDAQSCAGCCDSSGGCAQLTLSAVNSTDDHLVAQYRFTLLPPVPGGATSAALANNGVKITTRKTTLTIPSGATGTFRVGLEVWDDCGQKAAATAIVALDVVP